MPTLPGLGIANGPPAVFDALGLLWAVVALGVLVCLALILSALHVPDRATYTIPCPERRRPALVAVAGWGAGRWTRIESCSLCPLGRVHCSRACLRLLG
jgi:hypothetical protein